MKSRTLLASLIVVPGALAAQQAAGASQSNASARANASASARANVSVDVPAQYSTEAKAKIQAAFERAKSHSVPDQQMRDRLAEGQAKGASDAQVASSVEKSEARLEASQSLLVKAGRAQPSADEVSHGAQAIERGATEADIAAAIKGTSAAASLTTTLDGLASGAVSGAVQGATNAAGAAGSVGATVNGAATAATVVQVERPVQPRALLAR